MKVVNEALVEIIKEIAGADAVFMNEPMSHHTTFKIGGEAEVFVKIKEEASFVELIGKLNKFEIPYYVIGNGSNLLVGDKGIQGVVIETSGSFNQIQVEGNIIEAQAGALLSQVAGAAREHGLTGLEFAAGIPGTIGGALVMNAGAYDGEMKMVVESVRVVSREGEIMTLDNDTMEFSYRHSVLKEYPFVALSTRLRLESGDRTAIGDKMKELACKRREKQPLEFPSAGSTFKRPEGNFAGKLIMDAGLRGYRVGGAQVSEKHCGFVVNIGGATASDVVELMDSVNASVKEKFNVELEPEVIFLGDF